MEVEAKFITKPEVFEKILKLKDVAKYKIKEVQDIKESDTYFDTEELDLHKQRVSFRIREKDGTFLVTLKEKLVKTGAIYSRIEEEEYIEEKDAPKVSDYSLKIKPVIEAKKLTHGKKLKKMFTIDKRRKRAVLVKDDFIIRLDMDTINFRIDSSGEEYELEVESKNAPVEEVKKVQDFLKEKFGKDMKASKSSKYERGLVLFRKFKSH